MRIFNRAHFPWFVFVIAATLFAIWLYLGNFAPNKLSSAVQLPHSLVQKPSGHRSVGGTPLGLIFGSISLGIFIFAALLGVRKKIVLWRIGTLQRWLRAHIWLTLLTIPLVILHSGFRLGGPMTTLLLFLYAIVMISGIYGLALQHQMPRMMKERLPAETVYEQIPHILAQLLSAAQKMRDTFKSADRTDSSGGEPVPPPKPDAGAPAPSASKVVTTGSTPMASTSAELSTPTARAKTVVGSTITAATVAPATAPAAAASIQAVSDILPAATKPPETMGTPTARVPEGAPVPSGKQPAAVVTPTATAAPKPPTSIAPATASDPDSEAALMEFLDQQILPYLATRRGDRFPLGKSRYAEDLFRFVKLRVSEAYRNRVEEIQAWCDERRMLDLQIRMQHWLHGWLFVHVPISFLLILLTFWHAYVTLFYY